MVERTGITYMNLTGIANGSASLKGRDKKVNPLQLFSLSRLKQAAGSSLTWGRLRSYQKEWGSATEIRYPVAMPGYTYVWNLDTLIFSVTDDNGTVTMYPGVMTLKALGVSWGVLKSSQFTVMNTNVTNSDIFLIGAKTEKERQSYAAGTGQLTYMDYLIEGSQHIAFSRLSRHETAFSDLENDGGTGTYNPILDFIGSEIVRTILLSSAGQLQMYNHYPVDLAQGGQAMPAERLEQIRQGVAFRELSYLMIALFAQNKLSASHKVLYEPWMLYQIWQWYFNTVRNTSNSRKIFDLSPRWG
ncbi:hypothetical protein [Anaerospora sp.]|uniref:hypothetical protein n=1 Tax=Anaerospora sp. TaxID=1960278 RepID=UPI0028A1165B|nr:hypothetical protein [Anaerospora sp.]